MVQAGVGLDVESCEPGDKLLWDRSARLALERLSGADRNPFAIEELDVLPLSKVGGRKSSLARLKQALTNCLLFPERAKMFGLPTSNVLLLHGPPGTGKTYLVRAALSEIQRRSGKKVMFAVVNAAGWESPYVGVTQQESAIYSLRFGEPPKMAKSPSASWMRSMPSDAPTAAFPATTPTERSRRS